ncbi:hypothetical protein HA466_0297330 [Hirschfeldia incana]|nr:hypothetical protein HA466_0297330 [Hirschfeldia incana]KAJ0231608.1 hypothetical protein HA466_0297330 [Hirschfeldia incana]
MESFVKALKEREEHIEAMYKKEKILVDTIKTQHERWVSDIQNYERKLSQKEDEIKTLEMIRLVEKANRDQLLLVKERALSLCKDKLDQTQDELDNFKAMSDILTLTQNKEGCSNYEDTDECRLLEAKIRKQKHEFAKLAFGKRCDQISPLEASFAWDEFKRIESGFTEELMRKEEEMKEANKSILSLQEQLQASNHEKDKIMSRVAELVDNASKKKAVKISRITHEVKPLRRSARIRAMQVSSNNRNPVD